MLNNPVEILLAVAEIGGSLARGNGDSLHMRLPKDCPTELKNAIRAQKAGLLALLTGPYFVVVRSELFPAELLFWTHTDEGRDLLVAHGAAPGQIYTLDELRTVVARNPDHDTLTNLHRAKRQFNGRLSAP